MEASRGPPRVKNKAAADVQITAEQLLREAVDRQDEKLKAPTQRFADLEELHEFQGRKRKEFEDYVRRNRISMRNWIAYATWELEQVNSTSPIFESTILIAPRKNIGGRDQYSNERWTWIVHQLFYGQGISTRKSRSAISIMRATCWIGLSPSCHGTTSSGLNMSILKKWLVPSLSDLNPSNTEAL